MSGLVRDYLLSSLLDLRTAVRFFWEVIPLFLNNIFSVFDAWETDRMFLMFYWFICQLVVPQRLPMNFLRKHQTNR